MDQVYVESFLEAFPAARSKLLIDMVNCLDVADGDIRVAKARQGTFFSRCYDSVSGQAQQRNNAIAEHQQTSLRNVINVTTELARSIAHGHRALAVAGERLTTLELSLARVANVVAAQRDALHSLRTTMCNELERVDAELNRLDMHTAAQDHTEWVFSRWDAGGWDALPLAGRCYVAMNELYWGNFGEYCRRHPGERSSVMLETVKNKAVARLRRDASTGPHQQVALSYWLAPTTKASQTTRLFAEGLSWLGEAASLHDAHPIGYLCTQWHTLGNNPQLPLSVPRIPTAERLTGLVTNVFFEEWTGAQHEQ